MGFAEISPQVGLLKMSFYSAGFCFAYTRQDTPIFTGKGGGTAGGGGLLDHVTLARLNSLITNNLIDYEMSELTR